jgi:integrase
MSFERKVVIINNPNGFGSVVHLKGNRRNPFVVRKTAGWNEKGHPIYLVVGYFATREAAMIALAAYNQNPYDLDATKFTLEELYNKWSERAFPKMSKSSAGSLKSAFKHCKALYRMRYRDIKAYHMQDIIDGCGKGYSTQWAIKNLFGHLDKFGLEMDVINKGYTQLTTAAPIPETSKKPFTDEEVAALWKSQNQEWVDSVLVFLYSGWRISELLGLKREDVDLTAGTMRGGVKTKSGKNRVVPIHSRIRSIIERRYAEGGEYLFQWNGKKVSTTQYYIFWKTIMEAHGMNHTPHECRHTFRSCLDSAGANRVAVNKIMGHSGADTGERVYAHKSIQELKDAIELIRN